MAGTERTLSPIWIKRLEDLRKRLVIIALTVVSISIVSFFFIDTIRAIIMKPAGFPELIYITPAEALMANIRLAFSAGFLLTLPITIYQIIALIWPVMPKDKKRIMVFLPFFMFLLFAVGLTFAYTLVYPIAIDFFKSFEDETLIAMFTLQHYLSFSLSFLFAFGLVFQLPIVFWFLGALGLVTPALLRKNRKFAILVMLILSAFITPPDIFSQFLMILPLIFLYELGIIMVVITQRRKRKDDITE